MTLNLAPLVYLHVLADTQGQPAALLLSPGPGDPGLLAPALGGEAFAALPARLPSFYPDGLDDRLVRPLAQAGWRALGPGGVVNPGHHFDPALVPPGARWLEGDWYLEAPARPTPAMAAARSLALRLVQLVSNDADTREIEQVLKQDARLSYHLMRLVNSVGTGAPARITSYSQAILLLGRDQLRRWLNLMVFASRPGDVRSAMLLAQAALRAHAVELLAREAGLDRGLQEQGFIVGLFSLLDVLFGMPLPEVLAPLSLGDAAQAALLRREGELGALLASVEQAGQGRFEQAGNHLAALQVTHDAFNRALALGAARVAGLLEGGGAA